MVINDRGETAYFFVDHELKKYYPMNTYMRKIGFEFDEEKDVIPEFDINFSLYGFGECPIHFIEVIKSFLNHE